MDSYNRKKISFQEERRIKSEKTCTELEGKKKTSSYIVSGNKKKKTWKENSYLARTRRKKENTYKIGGKN